MTDELATIGINASKTTVAKILNKLGFSLKTNVKRISNGGKVPTKVERETHNKQYEYM